MLDAKRLFSLNQQLYAVRERALSQMIGERLLAREARDAGQTVEDFVTSLPVEPIDEREVELVVGSALQRNPAIDPEKLRHLVRDHLRDQRREEARRKHIERLKLEHKKAGTPIVLNLHPPRVHVPIAESDPTRGKGPVEVVEFSDFECPYCQKAQPMVKDLMARYEGKVRLIWKDFPLPNHQHAVAAAIAARCAGEQGRFWEYHDVLFDNQHALSAVDLRRHARVAGLDVATFDSCIASGRYREALAAIVAEADEHLIEVTPTFLVNGRVIQGAASLHEVAAIVEEELGN
jgi:protein-disulfide isomerase